MRRLILALGLLFAAGGVGPPATGEDGATDEPIRVLLAADDVALDRIWRGISKGLELANLPKAGTERLRGPAPEVLARLEADPPPLVFVLGSLAADALGDALEAVPRVYVDVAWNVNGDAIPGPRYPRPPARVVRQIVYGSALAQVLRDLWPQASPLPRAFLSWPLETEALEKEAAALGLAAGFIPVRSVEEADLLLHVALGVGEKPLPLERLVGMANEGKRALVSAEPAHWRKGAAVLLLPSYDLLGRIAAEEGRLLLASEGKRTSDEELRVTRREAGVLEIRVDLAAARRQGLRPPLEWLARVDVLRDVPGGGD